MSATLDWLERTRTKLADARAVRAVRTKEEAPDFNLVRFLRNDEDGLSDLLAHLLDPRADHGQGDALLRLFIDRWLPDWRLADPALRVAVQREYRTRHLGRNRFIDLVILFGDQGILAIESKLWNAVDQDQQVADYLTEISRINGRGLHRLMYLTQGSGKRPTDNSISEESRPKHEVDGSLLYVSALELAQWLDDCVDACKPPRVRELLRDFAHYLRVDLQGGTSMTEQRAIVNFATGDVESLHAALEIVAAGEAIKTKLLDDFVSKLNQRLPQCSPRLARGWHAKIESGQVLLHAEPAFGLCLGLGFGGVNEGFAYAGVTKLAPSARTHEIASALRRRLGSSPYHDAKWPWWTTLNPDGLWASRNAALAALLDPEASRLLDRTVDCFEKVLEALHDDGLLLPSS